MKRTRKVRRTLNQAINGEQNAGRLRTDWESLEAEEATLTVNRNQGSGIQSC